MSTPESSESPSDQAPEQHGQGDIPVPGEHAKGIAKEMMKSYEGRPTAVLPGSHNTVTGTAVNDWLNDEGQPIYGKDEEAGNSA